ncbi:MAG TPA: transcription termination factor NusA [Verrucomicrobiota bacterium]|nr:transcription termination/antitermination protein NusA [Verrucomicrobiales bacterium]HRI12152.1 transcription termination factor NusA [Verrucomicrobiota bacterium]
MNAELLANLEYFEREKGISREILLGAVQEALLAAAKKAVGPARELRVEINGKSGEIKAWAKLIVADRIISKHDQLSVFDARRAGYPDAKVGDEVEVEVTPTGFGRIASQYAKQALTGYIRKAEKAMVYEEFKDRVGDIVSGTVRRFDKSDVVLDLGKFEAILPNRERVAIEEYQVGERIRCFVKAVEQTIHGPEIILSRADPNFVLKLFKLEVAELNDGTIEVKAIAREPGFRTKLAVYSRDPKVDPVGACVGLRGQRVKNIVRELNNEKVDIIPWSADIKKFVAKALDPATVKTFVVNEASKRILVTTSADQLPLAVGRRGQNARLASRLTGWQIDIEAEADANSFDARVDHAVQELASVPGISEAHARILVVSGFHGVEGLLEAEVADLSKIPEIGDAAATILEAARGEVVRRQASQPEPGAVATG